MTYTKKMHNAIRRDTVRKHNIITDLLDEIERLQKENNSLLERKDKMINYFEELSKDINNIDLPKNSNYYKKINGKLISGKRFYWYYEEDLECYQDERENIKDYLCNLFSGICVPCPGIEYNNGELDIENVIIICDCQPTEKSYPEVYWITLGRLLDDDNLIEFFESPIKN